MIFSCLAYFLVENKEPEDADSKVTRAFKRIFSNVSYFFVGNKKLKGTESKTASPKSDDQDAGMKPPDDIDSVSKHQSSTLPSHVQPIDELAQAQQSPNVQNSNNHTGSSAISAPKPREEDVKFPEYKEAPKFRGRRFLLLMSFATGVVTLLLTSMMFNISDGSTARLPMITFFIIVFTAFYSPVSMHLVGILIFVDHLS